MPRGNLANFGNRRAAPFRPKSTSLPSVTLIGLPDSTVRRVAAPGDRVIRKTKRK